MRKSNANCLIAGVLFSLFTSSAMAWVPGVAMDLSLPQSCRPEYLEDGLLAVEGDMAAIQKFSRSFFDRCERIFRSRSDSTWFSMIRMKNLEYDFASHPGIRKVEFVDHRDQVVRPGFLGLQPGNRARPLIIYQCGVQCNIGDPSMRSFFIGLFDTGVFHVLALPSSTGSEYQKQNGVMALGGVDEGRQLMRIALMLKGPSFPHAYRISDVHLIGASLGGHSALYASLYADHFERTFHRRPFDSVLAACPVVRLQPSIENITRKSVVGRIFYSSFVSQILEVLDSTPILREIIPSDRGFKPKYADLRRIIADGALDYYKNKTRDPSWSLPPLENTQISTVEELWATNDYAEYGHHEKIRPVFIVTSKDDPVVKTKENTDYLLAADASSGKDPKVFSLLTERGNHCMFEAAFGWQTAGAFFRGFFLSASPEYTRSRRRSSVAIPESRVPRSYQVKTGELRKSISWRIDKTTKAIRLVSSFRGKDCVPEGRLHNTTCFRESSIPFFYGELGLDQEPKNRAEILALERRLNTNFRIYDKAGRYLSQTEDPARVEILNY